MEIRYIQPEDAQETGNIYAQSWKYAYKDIIPQSYLDNISGTNWACNLSGGRKSLVMTESGKIIGTASFSKSRWTSHEDYGEIVSIYFLPEYIGKGYGKALLDRTMEELKQLGFEKILLWVLADNQRARAFYERNGFAATEEFQMDIIGGKALKEVLYVYPVQ